MCTLYPQVEEFPYVLGNPNAVLHGSYWSNSSQLTINVNSILIISSPVWNSTTRTLTFQATPIEASSDLDGLISASVGGSVMLSGVELMIDSEWTISRVLCPSGITCSRVDIPGLCIIGCEHIV